MAPQIRVNGGAAGVKAAVSAATAWTATLDSTTGVRSTVWTVIGTDETSAAGDYTLVQSGSVGQTVDSTSLGNGTALILRAVTNGGRNLQTGENDPVATTATVKIYVPTTAGLEVGAAGEEYESDATYGSTALLNAGIRLADSFTTNSVSATTPITVDNTDPAAPIIGWSPTANVSMDGYGFTSCVSVANASGALALSAGSGNATIDASAVVVIGGTGATRVDIGRAGQQVRMPAYGVGRALFDADGDLSSTAITFTEVQTALGVASGGIGVNNQQIKSMADPTDPADAATKQYVDAVASGLSVRTSVRAKSTGSNVTLSGTTTLDGVALNADDAVLLADQTDPIENGFWVVSAGAWARRSDLTTNDNARSVFCFVEEGTLYHDTGWTCTNDEGSDVVGTDGLTWTQFSGADTQAGAGLTKTGNTIDVVAADATITVNANSIEASGDFGAKPVYSDGGFDTTNGAVPLQIGTGNAGDITIGQNGVPVSVDSTLAVSDTITRNGASLATTTVAGIVAVNNTAATGGTPVQRGYFLVSSGAAYDTDDTVSRTVRGGWGMAPTSGTTVGYNYRLAIDPGTGTLADSALYYASSDPAIGGTALVSGTFVAANGNYFRLYNGSSRGGLNLSGNDVRVVASTDGIILYAGSKTRVYVASTGAVTFTMDASVAFRREYGTTSGIRYVDYVSAEFTSDASGGLETAITYAMPDNAVADITIIGVGIENGAGNAAGYKKRLTVKRFSAGSATVVGSERDLGGENEDVPDWDLESNVSGNNMIVQVDSAATAAKWGIDLEVHVRVIS